MRAVLILLLAIGPAILARAEDISVAAAISLKESLEAIRPQYESATGDHLKLTFASSGQLAAQIQNGAPVDLFLSAARKQVDDLIKAKKLDESTAVVVAGNDLVLIVPAAAKSPPASFDELADAKVQRIAVGEPKSVPAGEYAQQTLDHLKLTDKLKGRLIYGLNVRQVLQYVESGEVDAGLVYLSDAKQGAQQVKVMATADADWHQPIEYWGAIVSDSKQQPVAKKFLDYLGTEPAQTILQAKGFARPVTHPNHPTTAPTNAPAQ
jgi:molybdate transport system substrate-binding protein